MAKILVVDDSELICMYLEETLDKSGHQVIIARDGLAGVKAADENKDIELIILDFGMPQMDGVTMAKKIREIPELAEIPMLMLTTESNPIVKEEGKKAGIWAWISKPLIAEKLTKTVDNALEQYRSVKSA
ncbi:MAG: hypothetical protein CMP10_03655 [Zetaproteobacteria bacterium]|nr:hypothetical protein [Pseudobdellovibrionaceae bacterium]